jgi:hypothetical protein
MWGAPIDGWGAPIDGRQPPATEGAGHPLRRFRLHADSGAGGSIATSVALSGSGSPAGSGFSVRASFPTDEPCHVLNGSEQRSACQVRSMYRLTVLTRQEREQARRVRAGVDVLACDKAVAEGEDVDAVPLAGATLGVRGGRRPFADHEVVGDVAAATVGTQVGLIGEGGLEQLPDGRSLRPDCASVVLEPCPRYAST